jgi:hypothetical protein
VGQPDRAFELHPGVRQLIRADIDRALTSCGFAARVTSTSSSARIDSIRRKEGGPDGLVDVRRGKTSAASTHDHALGKTMG